MIGKFAGTMAVKDVKSPSTHLPVCPWFLKSHSSTHKLLIKHVQRLETTTKIWGAKHIDAHSMKRLSVTVKRRKRPLNGREVGLQLISLGLWVKLSPGFQVNIVDYDEWGMAVHPHGLG